jgi:hypothetical protein
MIMMKIEISLCLSLVALGGLLGCSTRVPAVKYHHGLYQKKVQALKHWDLMAKEVVDKITSDPRFAGKAIAVNETTNATVFMGTFNELIKTELLKRNALSVEVDAATTLHVQTQLVRHNGKRFVINPSSLISGAVMGTVQLVTGGAFGTRRETSSELLVISLAREEGIPKMGVKQIVYVDRHEDAALYLRAAKPAGSETASTLKVNTEP